ncbi:M20 aminoacylase family protein [Allopusillimonas ginsengisoli]|uniref:M20 aminoacylase family protein n=1 Tax=Allopusillimonas ginsengisoli TaxID=453575 RepID=UPI0010203157|nr:M20 aminoacylase family protein [Allopusillimonas ginsengisoli]TEA77207.1 amidohydrolase [Allopusillimonas ginsengisoli]
MKLTDEIIDDMKGWRHHLHAHPELAFEEFSTAKMVATVLRSYGIQVYEAVGRTGVVGTLTRGKGRCIGLRADMDALPMDERNQFAHKSVHPGKMHGCGHDGHTAMLLGAAATLSRSEDWQGTVNFIFQPAEEAEGGGRAMIEDDLFERFPCDMVFGMHNWPGLPLGQFAINAGPMMASFDTFEIDLRGKGGHAAMPETAQDILLCASNLVVALQAIVSRRISPLGTAVLSVTQIHGGASWNVLPDQAVVRGTVRCYSPETQNHIRNLLQEISQSVAITYGATAHVDYRLGYPATINAPDATAIAAKAAARVVGNDNVQTDCRPSMASEDFAFMLNARPGAYIWLGVDAGATVPLHNPHYDFNDKALAIGTQYWVALVHALQSDGA